MMIKTLKMHYDWFNGTEILQGRWQHGDKVGYCYPSELQKTLWTHMSHWSCERVNTITKSFGIILSNAESL
jgi:hypothetical protein